MRFSIVFICCVLLTTAATAQQIYRWVDDDGVVHYSDQPRGTGQTSSVEAVDIKVPPGISNPIRTISTGGSLDDPDEQSSDEPLDAYRDVAIAEPAEQQVVWNIATRLPVQLTVDPPLAGSHRIQLELDGQPIGEPISETSTTVSPVYRGEHSLTPVVIDADGNTVFIGATTTFYVQQASVNRP